MRAGGAVDTLRHRVEERGGCPAHVKETGGWEDPGIVRIDYTGFQEEKSGGEPSPFSKLVSRS